MTPFERMDKAIAIELWGEEEALDPLSMQIAKNVRVAALSALEAEGWDAPTDDMATEGARVLRDTLGETNQHARAKKVFTAMIAARPSLTQETA